MYFTTDREFTDAGGPDLIAVYGTAALKRKGSSILLRKEFV